MAHFSEVLMWIDICICLPLTVLVICSMFNLVPRCLQAPMDGVPRIYYTNVLISNLISFFVMIAYLAKRVDGIITFVVYLMCVMASLYFKMFVALERSLIITFPQKDCIRQKKAYVSICVLVWLLCIIILPVSIFFGQVPLGSFLLLPAPVFISSLAATLKGLCSGSTTDETERIVGILVLLLLIYSLTIFTPTIDMMVAKHLNPDIHFCLYLLSPVLDLIVYVFMRGGSSDKFLAYLPCCGGDTTKPDDTSLPMNAVNPDEGEEGGGQS